MLYLALPLILTALGFHSNYSNEPSSTHTQTETAIYRHSYIDCIVLKSIVTPIHSQLKKAFYTNCEHT